jgi:head-tail adaptor
MTCKKITLKNKKYNVNNFTHRAIIYSPMVVYSSDDFYEMFIDKNILFNNVHCGIETTNGVEYINGVGTIVDYTHKIYMRYFTEHQQKLGLEINKMLYEVIRVEVANEDDRFLCLKCIKKGSKDIRVNNV